MSCNVHYIHGSLTCVGRLAHQRKPGSSLGYLSLWLYPYLYGASFSIWFITLSQSYRNPSSGANMNNCVCFFVYTCAKPSSHCVFYCACLFIYFKSGYYGWSQFTAWTVWVELYPTFTFAADIKKLSMKDERWSASSSFQPSSGSPWNTLVLPFTWTRAESVMRPTSSTTSWPSCSTSWKTSIPAWWWCSRSRSSRNTCLLSAAAPRGRWESEFLLEWTDSSRKPFGSRLFSHLTAFSFINCSANIMSNIHRFP